MIRRDSCFTDLLRHLQLPYHAGVNAQPFSIAILSDELRLPNPARALALKPLPYGPFRLAVIYRSLPDTPHRAEIAAENRAFCQARGYYFLVAADIALALRVRADGVHLPERDISKAAGLRRRFASFYLTASVHSARAITAANAQPLDGVFLSPVFATKSVTPNTRKPKTPLVSGGTIIRAASLVQHSRHPVWALGGIHPQNAARLRGCGFAGGAMIDAVIG